MVLIDKAVAVGQHVSSFLERQKPTLKLVERGLQIFPVLATVLVGLTFLLGGCIGVWQWWMAVGMVTIGIGLWAKRKAISPWPSLCLWGLFFVVLYLFANLFSARAGMDDVCYHYPAMRLLIEGWNPVTAPTPELLAASMGIDIAELRWLHVLFMSKGVWFFNSVANLFTGNPYNLTFPLFPFLFVVVCGELWRLMRSFPVFVRLLGCILLYVWCPSSNGIVDATICLAGIGVVSSMTRCLRGESNVWLPMMVFTFWMMVAKQMGLLTCFIFWVVFLLLLVLKQRKTLLKAVLCGSGCTLLFLTVCVTPYITSWIHYEHPFYPAMTKDAERFPVMDITSDFKICNEDAKQMGHFGSFCNAYVSPMLTQAYYKWKLDQESFAPNRYVWEQGHPGGYSGNLEERRFTAPFPNGMRWKILLSYILFFILAKRELRLLGFFILAAMFAFPTPYLGYLRYVPWQCIIHIMVVCLIANYALRFSNLIKWGIGGVLLLVSSHQLYQSFVGGAIHIENEIRNEAFFNYPHKAFYACHYDKANAERFLAGTHSVNVNDAKSLHDFGDPSMIDILNIRLLCRKDKRLTGIEIEPVPVENVDAYPLFAGTGIRYNVEEYTPPISEYEQAIACPNRFQRYGRTIRFALKSYLIHLPKLIQMRLLDTN